MKKKRIDLHRQTAIKKTAEIEARKNRTSTGLEPVPPRVQAPSEPDFFFFFFFFFEASNSAISIIEVYLLRSIRN